MTLALSEVHSSMLVSVVYYYFPAIMQQHY